MPNAAMDKECPMSNAQCPMARVAQVGRDHWSLGLGHSLARCDAPAELSIALGCAARRVIAHWSLVIRAGEQTKSKCQKPVLPLRSRRQAAFTLAEVLAAL